MWHESRSLCESSVHTPVVVCIYSLGSVNKLLAQASASSAVFFTRTSYLFLILTLGNQYPYCFVFSSILFSSALSFARLSPSRPNLDDCWYRRVGYGWWACPRIKKRGSGWACDNHAQAFFIVCHETTERSHLANLPGTSLLDKICSSYPGYFLSSDHCSALHDFQLSVQRESSAFGNALTQCTRLIIPDSLRWQYVL